MTRQIVLLLLLVACKKPAEPVQERASEPGVQEAPTPIADKIIAEDEGDPAWLSGTWQQKGQRHWFLFNLPSEVAELSGKPPRVVRRGRLVVHGRFVSAVFNDAEVHFEASEDRGQLQSDAPRAVYRRGAPP